MLVAFKEMSFSTGNPTQGGRWRCASELTCAVYIIKSDVVDIFPGEFAGIGNCLLQHLLSELIVVFEFQGFVVEADGFIELSAEMVDEAQGEECLSIARIQTHALLEEPDRAFVVLEFSAGMGQIGQNGLQDPKTAIRMAQPHRLLVALPGLLVVLLLVVDDPQLGIDEGIRRTDLLGLHQGESSSLEVVCPQIFHPHVKVSLRAPREQPHNGPVDGHGLV